MTLNNYPYPVTEGECRPFSGSCANAGPGKASGENERHRLATTDRIGQPLASRQVAGLRTRLLCHVKAGDMLARGQCRGFIRFGWRTGVCLLLLGAMPKTAAVGGKLSATDTGDGIVISHLLSAAN